MKKNKDISIRLTVEGMTWMSWVPKVVGALAGRPGIIEANAFYPEKEARVVYDPELIGVEGIVRGLSQAGYSAALKDPVDLSPSLPTFSALEPAVFQPNDLVCYCFGFTRAAIEKDFLRQGRSLILEKIAAEKKAGGCDCARKNPKGRWCLADVRRVVDRVKSEARN